MYMHPVRYDAPFPFGLRHADGSLMTIAQSVRRLAKLKIPVFAVPHSKIRAGQSGCCCCSLVLGL